MKLIGWRALIIGLLEEARQSAEQAIRSAPSEHIRQLLRVRLKLK